MWWHLFFLAPFYVSLACIPLLFGFGSNLEYEYATLLAWLLVIVAPVLGLVLPKSLIKKMFPPLLPPVPGAWWNILDRHLTLLLWLFVVGPVCLLFPGFMLFAFDHCQCSGNGFLFWMSIQVFPAFWIGSALHHWLIRFRFEGTHVLRRIFVLSGALLSCLLCAGVVLWFAPQKRIVHLLLGFIHGPIYDSWIPVDSGVVFARCSHFGFGLILLLLAVRRQAYSKRWKYGVGLLCTLFGSLWLYALSFPSGKIGHGALRNFLTQKKSSGFVTLYHAPGDESVERDMRVLLSEASFHAQELAAIFSVSKPRPISVYVYPHQDAKKIYFGGGATDVTDVYSPSVHITYDDLPHPTLRHELVHAVASQFGFYGLGFHPNMVITEGLAVALAPDQNRLNLDDASALLLKSDKRVALDQLFSPLGFWIEAGNRSYTLAGSFLAFLAQFGSGASLRQIYEGKSFLVAAKKSLKVLLSEWQAYVESQYNPARALEAEFFFRKPGVFKDVCPHTKADYARPRAESVWTRLRQPIYWDTTAWNKWRTQLDPSDHRARLDLWRAEVTEMAKQRIFDSGLVSTWIEVMQKGRKSPVETVEDVEIALIESDLFALLFKREQSLMVLKNIISGLGAASAGEGLDRQIKARLLIEEAINDPVRAREWRRYLAGWRSLPEVLAQESWIIEYLRMRREERLNLEKTRAHVLFPTDDMDPLFKAEWLRLLAGRLLRLEEFDQSAKLYQELAQISQGRRSSYYEMMARMANANRR